jgi:uncharacterized protein
MIHIYIDADACPVKNEVYRVAERYDLPVTVVANSWMRIPCSSRITLEVVGDDLDAADNWIVDEVHGNDIVITADIPLADRCIKAQAQVISPNGKQFTEEAIGARLAMRNLLSELREAGTITGGPPPFSKRDRSRFLQKFDEIIKGVLRDGT